MNENRTPIKKLSSFFSKKGLTSFFDDSGDEIALKKAQENIIRQLQIAAAQKSIVVLQVQSTEDSEKYETVSGRIATKTVGNENVMLRLMNDDQTVRMIAITNIKKISMLSPNGERRKASK